MLLPILNLPTIADKRERANRAQMLTKVRNFWIKGVLEQSLHGVAMIDFAKRVAVS